MRLAPSGGREIEHETDLVLHDARGVTSSVSSFRGVRTTSWRLGWLTIALALVVVCVFGA